MHSYLLTSPKEYKFIRAFAQSNLSQFVVRSRGQRSRLQKGDDSQISSIFYFLILIPLILFVTIMTIMVAEMSQKSQFSLYVLYLCYMKFYFCYKFTIYVIRIIIHLLDVYMFFLWILNLYDNLFILSICAKLL